jgi:NADH-quinone oxidoreductase subunit C
VTAEEVLEKLKTGFGAAIREAEVKGQTVSVTADAARNFEICSALRDWGFEFLNCLTGIDFQDRFEVVYNISSLRSPAKVHLRATTAHDDPRVRSVVSVWPTANWHERETWDLLGIRFDGHPDHRRILLPEDWVGHPLRKDYVDEGRYVTFVPYGEEKREAKKAAHTGPGTPAAGEGKAESAKPAAGAPAAEAKPEAGTNGA